MVVERNSRLILFLDSDENNNGRPQSDDDANVRQYENLPNQRALKHHNVINRKLIRFTGTVFLIKNRIGFTLSSLIISSFKASLTLGLRIDKTCWYANVFGNCTCCKRFHFMRYSKTKAKLQLGQHVRLRRHKHGSSKSNTSRSAIRPPPFRRQGKCTWLLIKNRPFYECPRNNMIISLRAKMWAEYPTPICAQLKM